MFRAFLSPFLHILCKCTVFLVTLQSQYIINEQNSAIFQGGPDSGFRCGRLLLLLFPLQIPCGISGTVPAFRVDLGLFHVSLFRSGWLRRLVRALSCAVLHTSFEEMNKRFNKDNFNPVDGKLVRLADHYSALMEADSSIRHGITSAHLQEGRANLLHTYQPGTIINGIDAYTLFNAFAD